MGYAVIDFNNVYAGAWSRWDNPPRPLAEGESVAECDWDDENNRPIGLTMPEPVSVPDWAAFRSGLKTSSAYIRICSANPIFYTELSQLMWRISESPEYVAEIPPLWNALATIAQPTAEEIAELNAIGVASNVPFAINAQGLMFA